MQQVWARAENLHFPQAPRGAVGAGLTSSASGRIQLRVRGAGTS